MELGIIVIQDLAQRLCPHFPRLAERLSTRDLRIENILPPASDAEIVAIERHVGVPLPPSYKLFLRCTRDFWVYGGSVQFGSQHPFVHDFPPLEGLTAAQQGVVRAKGSGWPPPSHGMLCFAEFFMEADGDQVLFEVSKGLRNGEYPVMYYGHEGHPPAVRLLAADFATFMNELPDRPEFRYGDD